MRILIPATELLAGDVTVTDSIHDARLVIANVPDSRGCICDERSHAGCIITWWNSRNGEFSDCYDAHDMIEVSRFYD